MPHHTAAINQLNHPPSFFKRLISSDATSGVLLMLSAIFALIWANTPWGQSYADLWTHKISVGFGEWQLNKSLGHWINDGLMALFFFFVGLEIKHEMKSGELSSLKKASLPAIAALGGMVVPAAFYLMLNHNGIGMRGWAVPMATDIAFSLGVMSMLGRSVPLSLKIFLTALAVVDDLGAVLVIAFFYTAQLSWIALGVAALCALALWLVGRFGLRNWIIYLVIGLILWVAMYKSGVHATLAGVIVAFLVPSGPEADPPLERWAHGLKPWVNLGIMPIFALANAGLVVGVDSLKMLTEPISLGIIMGLFLGKPIGIACFCAIAVKIGWSAFPPGQRFIQFLGVGCLAGIGFTMSIFIASLAFPQVAIMEQAKAGILLASVISAIAGTLILKLAADPVTAKN